VRRRGADGEYKILAAGVDFFKYHKSFRTPLFPRKILAKRPNGSFELVEARAGFDYVPLANLPQLTSATLRQSGDSKQVFATEAEQRAEVLSQAKAYLSTLDDIIVDGKAFKILYDASDVDHLYDSSREILVDKPERPTSHHPNYPQSPLASAPNTSRRIVEALRLPRGQLLGLQSPLCGTDAAEVNYAAY